MDVNNQDNIPVNSLKAWLLAARPKTLSGAAVPVMIGAALAYKDAGSSFQILPAVLCFLFAFIMQIDSNFINDYFDCLKGNDDPLTRLGPKRACSEGWITLPAMRLGLVITTMAGCIVGLPLIFYGGVDMIFVGVLCVLFAFLYTTRLSYLGLGDVLVLVFFGIVPVCLTYYVIVVPHSHYTVTPEVYVASVACGMVIDTLLLVNNYRDRDADRRDGKMTLVVRIGARNTERLYLWIGIAATLMMCVVCVMLTPLAILYLWLHISTQREMKRIGQGRELNRILGKTARNMFVFGLITTIAIIGMALIQV